MSFVDVEYGGGSGEKYPNLVAIYDGIATSASYPIAILDVTNFVKLTIRSLTFLSTPIGDGFKVLGNNSFDDATFAALYNTSVNITQPVEINISGYKYVGIQSIGATTGLRSTFELEWS